MTMGEFREMTALLPDDVPIWIHVTAPSEDMDDLWVGVPADAEVSRDVLGSTTVDVMAADVRLIVDPEEARRG